MQRRGFTALEILMTLGVLSISSGIAVPMFRQYLIRNDLEIARQNVSQGIERAKYLSQVAMNDSEWGFSTDAVPGRGVIFMGSSFATRNTAFDELYSLPETVTVTGVTEVTFSKIEGLPSVSGIITLTSLVGEERIVTINIGSDGSVGIPDDWMEICVNPYQENAQVISTPDSLWEYYEEQGAVIGDCPESGDIGGDAGSGGGTGGIGFTIEDKAVIPDTTYTCSLQVLGAALQSSGYDMPITMQTQEDGSWQNVFGDWGLPVNSNLNTGSTHTTSCALSSISADVPIHVRARSWSKRYSWYSGTQNSHWRTYLTMSTTDDPPNIEVLKNGDPIPSYAPLNNQATIEDFLEDYVNLTTGEMNMGSDQVIYLFELGTTNLTSSAADFQDLVLLLTLQES